VNEPQIKGAAVRELLLWHDGKYGHEETATLVEGLPPPLLGMLDVARPGLGILGASWYPTALTHPMLDRIAARHGHEGRELAREANRDVVPRMIHGIYRMAFRAVASPELYARHVPRLWRRLHTTGDRSMELRDGGEALSIVADWPGHHPVLCWVTIYTMAYVFEAMGYKHWTVDRLACVSHGAPRCETILRYRK
jgi:hypothetical protein